MKLSKYVHIVHDDVLSNYEFPLVFSQWDAGRHNGVITEHSRTASRGLPEFYFFRGDDTLCVQKCV